MRIANIKYYDVANGPGVRTSIFVQGCTHHCFNCFNQETWDFEGGEELTEEMKKEIFSKTLKGYNTHFNGFSILGGDLFCQPVEEVIEFLKWIKEATAEHFDTYKPLWVWTGYHYEEVLKMDRYVEEVLPLIDVMVDGPYVDSRRNLLLSYRGSENQRVIDVKNSLETGEIVLLDTKYHIWEPDKTV